MRVKFDKRVLEKLEPRASAYDVLEEGGPPGFCVRVTPSGSRTYCWVYKFGKKRRRLRLGDVDLMSVSAARKAYNAARALRDQGVDPVEAERQQREQEREEVEGEITVAELCHRYLRRSKVRQKKTYDEDVRQITRSVLPAWGRRPVRSISRKDVYALIDDVAERAPIAANRLLALVKPLFEYAEDREIIPASPAAAVKKPAKEKKRERALDLDECAAVLKGLEGASMGPTSRWVVRFLFLTGQRLGEVSGAQWSEFNGSAWNLPGERTKYGKPHRVPMTPLLQACLVHLQERAGSSPFVFPARSKTGHVVGDSVSSALGKERHKKDKKAKGKKGRTERGKEGMAFGVEYFTLHDIRRTVASRLAELGVEYEVIARLLNHSLAGITARYNQFDYWEPAQQAMETWHEKLLEITDAEDWPGVRLP